VKDFRVIIAGRGAGGRRKADRRVASVGGIVIVVCTLVVSNCECSVIMMGFALFFPDLTRCRCVEGSTRMPTTKQGTHPLTVAIPIKEE